jgi:hypothetical protein
MFFSYARISEIAILLYIAEVIVMKNNKKYLRALFLCSTLISTLPAFGDNLKQAIAKLDLEQVERELVTLKNLTESKRHEYRKLIETKIVENKAQQASKKKHLNKSVIIGSLVTTVGLSTLIATNLLKPRLLRPNIKSCAGDLLSNTNNIWIREQVVDHFCETVGTVIYNFGQFFGFIGGISLLFGPYQLYRGITTQALKEKHAKALAIKQLIEQSPTQ